MNQQFEEMEERVHYLENTSHQQILALQQTLEKLKIRNAWLESQTPEARAAAQLKRDITRKKEILQNKDNMLKLLDLD